MGASVQSFPMSLDGGTSLTFLRYLSISGDSYSAQLNVRNKVGDPHVRHQGTSHECPKHLL